MDLVGSINRYVVVCINSVCRTHFRGNARPSVSLLEQRWLCTVLLTKVSVVNP